MFTKELAKQTTVTCILQAFKCRFRCEELLHTVVVSHVAGAQEGSERVALEQVHDGARTMVRVQYGDAEVGHLVALVHLQRSQHRVAQIVHHFQQLRRHRRAVNWSESP
jgi:hypothetical protein